MVSRGWATPAFSLWHFPVFLHLGELDPGQIGFQNLQTPWNSTSPQHIPAVTPKGRRASSTQPLGALPELGLNSTTPVAQKSSVGVEKFMKNLWLNAEHSDMSCLCSFSLAVFRGSPVSSLLIKCEMWVSFVTVRTKKRFRLVLLFQVKMTEPAFLTSQIRVFSYSMAKFSLIL